MSSTTLFSYVPDIAALLQCKKCFCGGRPFFSALHPPEKVSIFILIAFTNHRIQFKDCFHYVMGTLL